MVDEGCGAHGARVSRAPRGRFLSDVLTRLAFPPTEPAQAASASEPLDITSYKNVQHHDYTPYTFLDLNLDLFKFRMPQPSSGRESPRH